MQHLWVANMSESVPAGLGACVEGPFSNPSGASIFYDISDVLHDDMAVSIVPEGSPCDGSAGYLVWDSTDWMGRQSAMTGSLAGGRYSLAVTCYNVSADCEPFLYAFGYED
jgi:hypothetical protein